MAKEPPLIDYMIQQRREGTSIVLFSIGSFAASVFFAFAAGISCIFSNPMHRSLGGAAVIGFVIASLCSAWAMRPRAHGKLPKVLLILSFVGAFAAQIIFNDILF